VTQPIVLYVGTGCATDAMTRELQCRQIPGGFSNFNDTINSPAVTVSIFDLLTPIPVNGMSMCSNQLAGPQTLWATVDTDGDSVPDYFNPQAYTVDTRAPTLPTNFSALPTDSGVQISFTPPADTSDILYYEAFCADQNGAPPMTPTTCAPDDTDATKLCPRYIRAQTLCGLDDPNSLLAETTISVGSGSDVDAGTEGPANVPDGLIAADPAFLCGVSGVQTTSTVDIKGLQNGTAYSVGIVAVDASGNYAGVYFDTTVTPQPVVDVWEDLHDRGSKVEGGFCLLESTYGDDSGITNAMRSFRDNTLASTAFGRWLTGVYYNTIGKLGPAVHGVWPLRVLFGILLFPLVAIALLWHWLTLPGLLGLVAVLWFIRRRRLSRWKLATAAATVAAVLAIPGHARADDVTPYWKTESVADDEDTTSLAGVPVVKWHAALRLGPYTPQIDKQLGGPSPGPYEAMFGGASVMPMLDVDRVLWDDFGQLGVGISVGYMGKKAHPYLIGTSPMDPNRPRSEADENTVRMIPLALSAVYRFTYLDDEYGIPVVPYVRAGLGYYVWFIHKNDNLAAVCKDGSDIVANPACDKNKGDGASLGVVGSIGIAIRAERIDHEAAKQMQQSGLEHAGFFGELSIGKVDGFGSQSKLSVGDTTWFAGVDFEF
jgi:hypothetical protein